MPAGGTGPGRSDTTDAARIRLAGALRDAGRVPRRTIQDAFLAVPRHLFLPELTPSAAYRDEALVIKFGDDGLPLSSSSQPSMMAIMLEQLRLWPGQRVLEIGTGTGYNAALIAHLVGRAGSVVSVDIDPELVTRATASLAAAGYESVRVCCRDGGYGDPSHAPYDRIIVTAGAWDIASAWLDQLGPGGILVLPLSVRGTQLSVALERSGDHWVATSACRCGFIRMTGPFAGPEAFTQLGPGRYVQVDDGKPVDTGALSAALAGPVAEVRTDLTATDPGALADLDLWLTITEPGLDRIALMTKEAGQALRDATLPFGGLASRAGPVRQYGLCGLAARATAGPAHELPEAPGQPAPTGPAAEPESSAGAPGSAAVPGSPVRQPAEARGSAAPGSPVRQPAEAPAPAEAPGSPAPGSPAPGPTEAPGSPAPGSPAPGPAEAPAPAEAPGLKDPATTAPVGSSYPVDIVVRGYGPGGAALAAHLAGQARAWDAAGRPGSTDLSLTAWPTGTWLTAAPWQLILDRPHIRLAVGWSP